MLSYREEGDTGYLICLDISSARATWDPAYPFQQLQLRKKAVMTMKFFQRHTVQTTHESYEHFLPYRVASSI